MATGYTYKIGEEESFSFEDFVWECAKAFDIDSRDEPDRPVRIEIPPRTSANEEKLKEVRGRLAELVVKTDAELQAEIDAAWERDEAERKVRLANEKAVHERYVAIQKRVMEWVPPTPLHERLKEFMLSQLRIGHFEMWERYGTSHMKTGEKAEAASARKDMEYMLRDEIQYYEDKIRDEIRHANERNAYFMALNKSVPQP